MIPSFTPGLKLEKEGSKQLVDATLYKQIVGYLCITVPYLANSVGLIRKIIEKWRKPPILVAKRILRYIKGKLDFGILFPNDKRCLKAKMFE
ncbi:hypothetical protein JHK86_001436 [Glycine max]|nr:hypothetical protein JHK86_001436 [Glycine max]